MILFTTDSSVYPGEYIPLVKENDFDTPKNHSPEKKKKTPSIKIKEQANSYKIEMPLPGIKRENLLLKVYGNILAIFVIPFQQKFNPQKEVATSNAENEVSSNHQITLPDDADPSFASAEFRTGTLLLHILKSSHPLKRFNMRIAVY